jgi:glycine oxidase
VDTDLSVDNRKLLDALRKSATAEHIPLAAQHIRPRQVILSDGSTVDCDVVVLAAGAWSGGLHPLLDKVIRPVKGEILRLRARPSALPPPTRTIRGLVERRHVYLVPREGGELVLGATQYEAGFDTEPAVGGVRDLIQDAERVVPGITEYALIEAAAGVRPGSPDNLPVIGWLEPGIIAATGHYRNGLLLAPVTADAVVALLDGAPSPPHTDPARFGAAR